MERLKSWLTGPAGVPVVAAATALATTALAAVTGLQPAVVGACVDVLRSLVGGPFGW